MLLAVLAAFQPQNADLANQSGVLSTQLRVPEKHICLSSTEVCTEISPDVDLSRHIFKSPPPVPTAGMLGTCQAW